jgi:L-malate glycosyltransferase
MEKIKIAYVIQRFHPFKGGAEQNTYALASRMAKQGNNVTVLTTNVKFRNEKLEKNEVVDGMNIIRHWSLNEQLYAGFYPSLLPYLLRNRFDVIHSSGIGFMWREFCLVIKKIVSPKTKFVVTPHGPFMAVNNKTGFRGFMKRFYTPILAIIVPWLFDVVIAVNPKQIEWMTKEYKINPSKIFILPNGIDSDYIEEALHTHTQDEKVVITYLNRHEWYKGIHNVIEAIHNIKQKGLNSKRFEFWIMGRAGNYTPKLTEMVDEYELEENVKFIFSPSDEQRDQIFYEESQINILPSNWEATGITLVEAMAKGNVLITTYQNEAAEIIIKQGENGYIYEYSDVDKLTEILAELINNFDLTQKIRRNNIEAAKDFTWEAIFPEYLLLLESLTNKNSSK